MFLLQCFQTYRPSDTLGLPRPGPRHELDIPSYQILENILIVMLTLDRCQRPVSKHCRVAFRPNAVCRICEDSMSVCCLSIPATAQEHSLWFQNLSYARPTFRWLRTVVARVNRSRVRLLAVHCFWLVTGWVTVCGRY